MADAGERKLTGTFHILIIEENTFVWFPRMAASIRGDVLVWRPRDRSAGRQMPWHQERERGTTKIGTE
jgi:hypothetical protein